MITFHKIKQWGIEKGLTGKKGKATIEGQMEKLQEEFFELKRAIALNDQPEIIDAIGDMVVVLTLLADLRKTSIECCVFSAYGVIANRTGKMVDGVFVKDKA
jgi:NTP pyrophosphatase (non-canonical NTP hydrolase)